MPSAEAWGCFVRFSSAVTRHLSRIREGNLEAGKNEDVHVASGLIGHPRRQLLQGYA